MGKTLTDSEAIDALGGTGVVAEMFDINDGAVSMWRTNGIPLARRFKIARALERKGIDVPANFVERVVA